MKDYFGKTFNVSITDSFVKIEMKDNTIVMTRAIFLQIQQEILESWLLNK